MKNSLLLPLVALFATATLAPAADPILNYQYLATNAVLRLSLTPDPRAYYTLEWTEDFRSFTNVGMAVGSEGPVWAYSVGLEAGHGFFRARAHDIFSPQDSDGDGIDDRYELEHPNCLDPLIWADASQPCLTNGMSNYQLYLRELFGGPGVALQFFSREESVFNFGAPTAPHEAISQEVSVYSAFPGSGPPVTDLNQVFSREVTTWNFGSPSAPVEAISREATVWNFGSPSANIEAISQEVSVYSAFPGSGPPATDLNNVYSRELTVFNFGAPTAAIEAISREVTVLNFEDPTQQ